MQSAIGFLTVGQALGQGAAMFDKNGIEAPRLNAEVLLCHALGRERSYLFGHPEEPLTELQWIHYGRYLHQRLDGKPTQYITGTQEFYGRSFRVTPDVLIPRPETEHLIEAVLPLAKGTVIDVGTGSGAIAITLALETSAYVIATDISARALRIAETNARLLSAPVSFAECDLLSAIATDSCELVVSNPPYVREGSELQREVADWEPRKALFAGPDGMDAYRRLIPEAHRVLMPSGRLALELGFDSLSGVRSLLTPQWQELSIIPDFCGIPRVLVCQRAS